MDGELLVQVGDIIACGTTVVLIAWTNREGIPVDAIVLSAPDATGNVQGTALNPDFLTYLGWLEDSDDDYVGNTWKVNRPGFKHVELKDIV